MNEFRKGFGIGALLGVALWGVVLCQQARAGDCSMNWMNCTADSPVQISSFSVRATDVITSISASRLAAAKQLTNHLITVEAAQTAQAKADRARVLWSQAIAACAANQVGNCSNTAATVKAFALLSRAKKALQ